MREKLDEFEREVKNAKTLKEYISAYRYRMENTIDASPYGVERTTEKRMLEELERFLPTLLLTREEFDRTYDKLLTSILKVNMQISEMKKGFDYLKNELVPEKEAFLDRQKKVVTQNIEKLEAEKEGYQKSIKILLSMKEN
ncbi:hypothetical protein KAU33_09120 [Candidatus Dependentiae bacterium]|nr:hypothetical protein [Candidatus Dependentiae bacterium]